MEMQVHMPLRVRLAIGRILVKAHAVGEGNRKEAVVARGQAFQDVGQAVALGVIQAIYGADVTPGHHHRLERPHRPKRHHRHPACVFVHQPFPAPGFERRIVADEAPRARLAPCRAPAVAGRRRSAETAAGPSLAHRRTRPGSPAPRLRCRKNLLLPWQWNSASRLRYRRAPPFRNSVLPWSPKRSGPGHPCPQCSGRSARGTLPPTAAAKAKLGGKVDFEGAVLLRCPKRKPPLAFYPLLSTEGGFKNFL